MHHKLERGGECNLMSRVNKAGEVMVIEVGVHHPQLPCATNIKPVSVVR